MYGLSNSGNSDELKVTSRSFIYSSLFKPFPRAAELVSYSDCLSHAMNCAGVKRSPKMPANFAET